MQLSVLFLRHGEIFYFIITTAEQKQRPIYSRALLYSCAKLTSLFAGHGERVSIFSFMRSFGFGIFFEQVSRVDLNLVVWLSHS